MDKSTSRRCFFTPLIALGVLAAWPAVAQDAAWPRKAVHVLVDTCTMFLHREGTL